MRQFKEDAGCEAGCSAWDLLGISRISFCSPWSSSGTTAGQEAQYDLGVKDGLLVFSKGCGLRLLVR